MQKASAAVIDVCGLVGAEPEIQKDLDLDLDFFFWGGGAGGAGQVGDQSNYNNDQYLQI